MCSHQILIYSLQVPLKWVHKCGFYLWSCGENPRSWYHVFCCFQVEFLLLEINASSFFSSPINSPYFQRYLTYLSCLAPSLCPYQIGCSGGLVLALKVVFWNVLDCFGNLNDYHKVFGRSTHPRYVLSSRNHPHGGNPNDYHQVFWNTKSRIPCKMWTE